MRRRWLRLIGVLAGGALLAMAGDSPKKPYSAKRMPDGHPDLQGTYDLATMTPMERPAGSPLVLTKEEAAKREAD